MISEQSLTGLDFELETDERKPKVSQQEIIEELEILQQEEVSSV